MSYQLDVRPEARTDIIQAAEWYDQQQSGLGVDFAEEVQDAIDSLTDNALLYRIRAVRHRRKVRWLLPERFPYRIIYFVEDNAVKIFAVLHAKRNDRAWKERV